MKVIMIIMALFNRIHEVLFFYWNYLSNLAKKRETQRKKYKYIKSRSEDQEINFYITDFLKTNLTKFAVICVKMRQKVGFSSSMSSKWR